MDFLWTQEQEQLRQRCADFARRQLNEGLRARDAKGEFNRAGWKQCADFGILGLPVAPRYGGSGSDALTTVGVLEELGRACKDNGLVFSLNAQMWTVQQPLMAFGSEEQREKWLPRLVSGGLIGANAVSEPSSGSDAYSLKTTARRQGDRYLLDGSKVFVTNGGEADLILVYANVDPSGGANGITAFMVDATSDGLTIRRNVEKMGMRTSPMAELFMEGCSVPVTHRVGDEGAGGQIFSVAMSWERSCILAGAVGAMSRLFDVTARYARERRQFGQSISKFQLVSSKIVDMQMRVETSRWLLYRTAWLRDRGKSVFRESAMTKLHISENWVRCAEDAMQVHGGYGYLQEFELERELRDALGSRIYSGTSEVQRAMIASLMGL